MEKIKNNLLKIAKLMHATSALMIECNNSTLATHGIQLKGAASITESWINGINDDCTEKKDGKL